jgi:glycosyltransferase involved in cell wall biosynthesis
MSKNSFEVSVVIPLYNHARYIVETIKSVQTQTLPVKEIIIVDDGSTDDSLAEVKSIVRGDARVVVKSQKNSGAHAAINNAIRMATSEHIAVLNSDDKFLPHKIARCAELFAKNAKLELVFGRVKLIDENSLPVEEGVTVDWLARSAQFLQDTGDLRLALLNENFAVTTSNMVFRRTLWENIKGFQALRYCHDLDFLLESINKSQIYFDAEVDHIEYRLHPNNTIKEKILAVRTEVACVLAESFSNVKTLSSKSSFSRKNAAATYKILREKELSHLLVLLMSHRKQFRDRGKFYKWAIGSATNNVILQAFLDGGLVTTSPLEHDSRKSPKSRPASAKGRIGTILVELQKFDRGGLEKVVLDTSLVFQQRGVQVVILSCGEVGYLGEVAKSQGMTVYQLPETEKEAFYEEILRRHSVTLAISHFSRTGYPIFKKLGIPNITFIHNVYAMLNGDALANFIADDQYVDRYISVSKSATRYAENRLGISERKISTIPNGLIIEEHSSRENSVLPADRAQFGFLPDDYIFLNVASYNLHKNHYLMAAAIELILRKRDDIKILCIGNTIFPPHIDELKRYLQQRGLNNNMVMPGYFEDVTPFFKMADAFILPSLLEGWSIAMNEAMFYGKPMLLTDTGGSAEVIENSDIGLLLPNEYGETLDLHSALLDEIGYSRRSFRTAAYVASAMTQFADNREYWQEAGKEGRVKIHEKYDFSKMIDSHLEVMAAVSKKVAS